MPILSRMFRSKGELVDGMDSPGELRDERRQIKLVRER